MAAICRPAAVSGQQQAQPFWPALTAGLQPRALPEPSLHAGTTPPSPPSQSPDPDHASTAKGFYNE